MLEAALTAAKIEPHEQGHSNLVQSIVDYFSDNGFVWIVQYGRPNVSIKFSKPFDIERIKSLAPYDHYWNGLWQKYRPGMRGGNCNTHWIPDVLETIQSSLTFAPPCTQIIPTMRQIGPKDESFDDNSGKGLIDRLAEIQSPDHDKREEREVFEQINAFLQSVTDKPDAKIEIPHHRKHVLVHMDNKVLPLSSLGTGIHEVIMIAAFCTIRDQEIICIEEPEIHLHPILQRKLIRYLDEFTDNQYFIATHSAAFIDTKDAAIFRVDNDGVQTRVKHVSGRSDRYSVVRDLGYKASDLMKSNAVIWVEGPSERIYLNHWIAAKDSGLIEGIHYSIMFYGGRLLSHLSADDEEVDEFIDLRALNQNVALVMDSDRDKSGEAINGTKTRLRKEFEEGGGVCWITKGREIENYVDLDVLHAALKQAHPKSYADKHKTGQYDHAFYFKGKDGKVNEKADKVKVARLVCDNEANLDVLDLKSQITKQVKMMGLTQIT